MRYKECTRRLARGVSRVRASCSVPRLQVRPLVSNNESLNSLNSLNGIRIKYSIHTRYVLRSGNITGIDHCQAWPGAS